MITDNKLRIVLLEDNWQQAEFIVGWLKDEFSDPEVRVVETVKEFETAMAEFKAIPPDLLILDLMVQYTDPDDVDLVTGGGEDFFTAGARCYELLRECGLSQRALIFSVTDKDDLRLAKLEHLIDVHVQKGAEKSVLKEAIRRIIRSRFPRDTRTNTG